MPTDYLWSEYYNSAGLDTAFFFFFYSLLTHPNACVFEKRGPCPPEKSMRKTYIGPTPAKS